MSLIKELTDLSINLRDEMEKSHNDQLASKLVNLQMMVMSLINENEALKKQLDISQNIDYDGVHQTYFTLKNDDKKVRYCAICYGYEGKLVPIYQDGCLICQTRKIGQ